MSVEELDCRQQRQILSKRSKTEFTERIMSHRIARSLEQVGQLRLERLKGGTTRMV